MQSLFAPRTRKDWHWVTLLGLVLCVGAVVLLVWESWGDYQQSRRDAEARAHNAAGMLESHFTVLLQQSKASIDNVAAELLWKRQYGPIGGADYLDALRKAISFDPQSAALFVLIDGEVWMVDHRARMEGSLQVQQQLRDMLAASPGQVFAAPMLRQGQWQVPMSYGYTLRDGRRIIVGALIPFAHLQRISAWIHRHNGAIGIFRQDGLPLMCVPGMGEHATPGEPLPPVQNNIGSRGTGLCPGEPKWGSSVVFGLVGSKTFPFAAYFGIAKSQFTHAWAERLGWRLASFLVYGLVIGLFVAGLRRLVKQLIDDKRFYLELFDTVNDGLLIVENGRISSANPAACALFGVDSAAQLAGRTPSSLFYPDVDHDAYRQIEADLIEMYKGGRGRFSARLRRRDDGSTFDAEVRGAELPHGTTQLLAIRDVSEERRYLAQQEFLATHDILTELPNRYALMRRIDRCIATAPDASLAVCVLDLNRFKEINDTLGHSVGDQVLQAIGGRLQQWAVSRNADVARLGGDELGLLVPDLPLCQQQVAELCASLTERVGLPLPLEEMLLEVSASIGIAFYPAHGNEANELLRCADVAMYDAKHRRVPHCVYDAGLDRHSRERLALYTELSHAIRDGGLTLYYQPKQRLSDGRIVGVEALLRWPHPQRGLIPPGAFIPMAENSELIRPLTAWVVDAAIRQLAAWRRDGIDLRCAINLSARNLLDPGLVEYIEVALSRHGVPATSLEFEVTESALMEDPNAALACLLRIHALGAQLSIDDYGSGYSSLGYLKRLPVQTLKIDRSFVSQLSVSQPDEIIVGSTITLAHNFGLTVVAEGVEHDADRDALIALGCDVIQGYWLAKPMPAAALAAWLAARVTTD
ncbi:putative bifunctional diguanylate cyclase/phosphodiesterase [Jeongeupia naejangsanensis]|uniref:EAL domain-containing protein n=1 Tax=Jeongeupia naejangsanensis TaxID=613195 RepID=A0ABS2BPG3_9NEIS|nr:EAL domain-containing protein [Jeongeupia naejangsanensis]MBM3117519.1 EAL domain-containing protein [Jeongeupia naejangsanensis]